MGYKSLEKANRTVTGGEYKTNCVGSSLKRWTPLILPRCSKCAESGISTTPDEFKVRHPHTHHSSTPPRPCGPLVCTYIVRGKKLTGFNFEH